MAEPRSFESTNPTPGWVVPEKIRNYEARFLALVVQPEGEDHFWNDTDAWYAECWPWMGKPDKSGQYFIRVHGMKIQIQRFMWLLRIGDVPKGLFPKPAACGLKNCVAPHHLALQNRQGSSERKIDDEMELLICKLYHEPSAPGCGWPVSRLAEKFMVSDTTIRRILSRHNV